MERQQHDDQSRDELIDDLGAASIETKGVEQEFAIEALEKPNARD